MGYQSACCGIFYSINGYKKTLKSAKPQSVAIGVCILAGGLSSRMGRDKAGLLLDQRTMLSHVRKAARKLGAPVWTLRKDSVSRCGPVGGIYTGLKERRSDIMLFLACDMPFVTAELLEKIIKSLKPFHNALFIRHKDLAGFPLLLRREACLPVLEQQIAERKLSLQSLAKALKAKALPPPRGWSHLLENINTPAEFEKARKRVRRLAT
jgi:molybdopterin-guanine dinucleotide biosynthesis protein A